jgi:cytoskeletal protein RodZ
MPTTDEYDKKEEHGEYMNRKRKAEEFGAIFWMLLVIVVCSGAFYLFTVIFFNGQGL